MIEERERIKEGEEKKIWEREREREREKKERIGEVKREKGGREKKKEKKYILSGRGER